MLNIILVAIGGAFGAVCRYLFTQATMRLAGSNWFLQNIPASFPLNTIMVNIIGSFLMGVLHFFFTNDLDSISPQSRLLLATGVLGGFTTFSAFSLDSFRLITAGQIWFALAYIFSSMIFSILAIFLGFYLLDFFQNHIL
jgi:CrcB protein